MFLKFSLNNKFGLFFAECSTFANLWEMFVALQGYSTDGYTTDGYTTEGYTTEGYTTEGYTTDGYTTDECFTETEEVTLRKEKYERRERLEQNKKYRTSLKIFAEDLCLATSDLTKTMMEVLHHVLRAISSFSI